MKMGEFIGLVLGVSASLSPVDEGPVSVSVRLREWFHFPLIMAGTGESLSFKAA